MVKKEEIANSNTKTSVTTKKRTLTNTEVQQSLIENFISLQKVLTNLSLKFDELSSNISKMLQLFEISAKSFADKHNEKEEPEINRSDKALLNKLDSLLDQNKTIAKGILLMENKIIKRKAPPTNPFPRGENEEFQSLGPKPLPKI